MREIRLVRSAMLASPLFKTELAPLHSKRSSAASGKRCDNAAYINDPSRVQAASFANVPWTSKMVTSLRSEMYCIKNTPLKSLAPDFDCYGDGLRFAVTCAARDLSKVPQNRRFVRIRSPAANRPPATLPER